VLNSPKTLSFLSCFFSLITVTPLLPPSATTAGTDFGEMQLSADPYIYRFGPADYTAISNGSRFFLISLREFTLLELERGVHNRPCCGAMEPFWTHLRHIGIPRQMVRVLR
jgi:hypothetical protein